ncbi:MAG: GntR family transcriptional regulator [Pegethrix bostrychoides GSE-TBD4-15B]|jgi:DNA-binding GntR family transcriptional regulator|uniref:GntR family transcriptional regulator n=1 Tax=Pegethrix bostrychoides GSE-TBD4-15B TaxID=2839662 RepID=A0A951PDD1_9CYAN|nr:GntR family transcriptional regulator [Pegethrix bostrychoides GSE-TBD4-15B]
MTQPSLTITPRSLDMQAADLLREQILKGRFAPGTRLLEVDLAAQFSLSRGTIRSALQQLTHEGLVVQSPYRGCAVCSLSSQDAWELYTLRQALESLAARLACDQITPQRVQALQSGLEALARAAEHQSWQELADADFVLHQEIVAISAHRRLQAQYRIVEQQIRLYIMASNALRPNLTQIVAEHQQLVAAIVSGNAELAAQVAKDHNSDGAMLVEQLRQIERHTEKQAEN